MKLRQSMPNSKIYAHRITCSCLACWKYIHLRKCPFEYNVRYSGGWRFHAYSKNRTLAPHSRTGLKRLVSSLTKQWLALPTQIKERTDPTHIHKDIISSENSSSGLVAIVDIWRLIDPPGILEKFKDSDVTHDASQSLINSPFYLNESNICD